MIIITGAAGFIGSGVVARLNKIKRDDLILVDHFEDLRPVEDTSSPKKKNLADKKYVEYFDKSDFLEMIISHELDYPVEAIIHMGACSSTTLQDANYFEKNNFQYTLHLAQWALAHKVRFIYASSAATYGDGSNGYKDDDETTRLCSPLNLYGDSKQRFDLFALENGWLDKMVGLKFFNVFGPNEYHKGDMRSVIAKAYQQVVDKGTMRLFKSYRDEFADGEQKRDFVYVKDAVDVIDFFLTHKEINGLFNVGTGQARAWNDLASALFAAVGKEPVIDYVDMPEGLAERYQYFTQADMSKLYSRGYNKPFMSLEEAIEDYAGYLKEGKCW